MASTLPTFPRLVFAIFEPISMIAGFIGAIRDPDWFVAEQIPAGSSSLLAPSDNGRMVALQLGNAYLLAAMVAMAVLWTTTEARVVRNYLVALWLADVGHVATCYYGLGHDRFMNIAQWNPMTYGNVAVTVFLCLTRTAYFLGAFGDDRQDASKKLQ